jgi:hypothetical protein
VCPQRARGWPDARERNAEREKAWRGTSEI